MIQIDMTCDKNIQATVYTYRLKEEHKYLSKPSAQRVKMNRL